MFRASIVLNYIVSYLQFSLIYLVYVAPRLYIIVKIISSLNINEEPSMYFVGKILNLCVFT